jgi:hypothetical protein
VSKRKTSSRPRGKVPAGQADSPAIEAGIASKLISLGKTLQDFKHVHSVWVSAPPDQLTEAQADESCWEDVSELESLVNNLCRARPSSAKHGQKLVESAKAVAQKLDDDWCSAAHVAYVRLCHAGYLWSYPIHPIPDKARAEILDAIGTVQLEDLEQCAYQHSPFSWLEWEKFCLALDTLLGALPDKDTVCIQVGQLIQQVLTLGPNRPPNSSWGVGQPVPALEDALCRLKSQFPIFDGLDTDLSNESVLRTHYLPFGAARDDLYSSRRNKVAAIEQEIQVRLGRGSPNKGRYNDRPRWDRDQRKLLYRGNTVKEIRSLKIAKNVVKILNAFEEDCWPSRVDDPLASSADGARLRDAIRRLNEGLTKLRFSADGSGKGVCWNPL